MNMRILSIGWQHELRVRPFASLLSLVITCVLAPYQVLQGPNIRHFLYQLALGHVDRPSHSELASDLRLFRWRVDVQPVQPSSDQRLGESGGRVAFALAMRGVTAPNEGSMKGQRILQYLHGKVTSQSTRPSPKALPPGGEVFQTIPRHPASPTSERLRQGAEAGSSPRAPTAMHVASRAPSHAWSGPWPSAPFPPSCCRCNCKGAILNRSDNSRTAPGTVSGIHLAAAWPPSRSSFEALPPNT